MVFLFIPSLFTSVGGITALITHAPFSATSAVVGQLVGQVAVAWSADSHRRDKSPPVVCLLPALCNKGKWRRLLISDGILSGVSCMCKDCIGNAAVAVFREVNAVGRRHVLQGSEVFRNTCTCRHHEFDHIRYGEVLDSYTLEIRDARSPECIEMPHHLCCMVLAVYIRAVLT